MIQTKTHPAVAIIGAGIAGIAAANALRDCARVVVLEKSRGIGGRMSTRRAEGYRFDHGARLFDCRNPRFTSLIDDCVEHESVAPWSAHIHNGVSLSDAGFVNVKVSTPAMNSLVKALADGVDVRTGVQVAPIETRSTPGWMLHDLQGECLGVFDWVICTAPAPQTATLLQQVSPIAAAVSQVRMQPTHALMVGLRGHCPVSWDIALPERGPLAWISVDSNKPGRDPGAVSLLAQTRVEWSQWQLETDPNGLLPELIDALHQLLGFELGSVAYKAVHRWRYASVDPATAVPLQLDVERQLAAGGDWCGESRVESAWLAGDALGQRVAAAMTRTGEQNV